MHLHECLLVPSGRGGDYARAQAVSEFPGCFTYQPPPGVVWKCGVRGAKAEARGSRFSLSPSEPRHPAAVSYLSRFLCVGYALALMATGCAGPRPLKGGKAVTTRKAAGIVEQTLVQGENASQATKQDQESIKVRTYTVPAGSRMEEARVETAPSGIPLTNVQ